MPFLPPLGAGESSDPTYSSMDSLNTDGDDTALAEIPSDAAPNIDQEEMKNDNEEDNRI